MRREIHQSNKGLVLVSARRCSLSSRIFAPFSFIFLFTPSTVFTVFSRFSFLFLSFILSSYVRSCFSCRDVNRFGTNRKEEPRHLIMAPEILSERYKRYVKRIFIDLSKTIKGFIVLIGAFARFPKLIFSHFYVIKYVAYAYIWYGIQSPDTCQLLNRFGEKVHSLWPKQFNSLLFRC